MTDQPPRNPDRLTSESGSKSPQLARAIREADLNYLRACQKSAAKTQLRGGVWKQRLVTSTSRAAVSLIMLPVRAVRRVCYAFIALGSLMGPRIYLTALAIALVSVAAACWPKPQPSLLELHRTLSTLHIEAEQRRSDRFADDRWKIFTERANAEIQSVVRVLENYANAADPASLHLLWAARDYLPRILNTNDSASRIAVNDALSRHLQQAERLISDSRRGHQDDGLIAAASHRQVIMLAASFVNIVICCSFLYIMVTK